MTLAAARSCCAFIDTTMASYADNRNALFGTSKKDAPKPKPQQKRSYTLGGQSKAAQQRQRERQQQLKQRGDDFYAAAEALMPPKKTGFAALMAKQPNPLLASSEYAKAADAYAAAGLNEKAIEAYRKASKCHNESNAPHTAARCLERACLLYTSPSPRDATLSRMPSSA